VANSRALTSFCIQVKDAGVGAAAHVSMYTHCYSGEHLLQHVASVQAQSSKQVGTGSLKWKEGGRHTCATKDVLSKQYRQTKIVSKSAVSEKQLMMLCIWGCFKLNVMVAGLDSKR
jgi:hypothetical protein